jgi:hypothetical protein
MSSGFSGEISAMTMATKQRGAPFGFFADEPVLGFYDRIIRVLRGGM